MARTISGRSVQVINRTSYSGFGIWVVQHFLDGCLICETKRKNRAEARTVARKYIETGVIPLN